ncbi:hypothetical protein BS47DRAFT_1321765 [Hydnum rufescens UP504]|uniref:Nuclear pore complex protein n=1 Tax=Hydnum rufescens UP504 TaxID=1448309 RepID=A0A9P6AIL8_9AGAM|nr:hypothetical protein BS47DRAFT_1321765 [Hydnum rufescens UP504]
MSGAIGDAATTAETLFAQSLQLFPIQSEPVNDESPVLDVSNGLAARFRQVCYDRHDELSETARTQAVPEDTLKLWELEQNTWELVADLYIDRAVPPFEGPSPQALVAANPYTPEKVLIRQALEMSSTLNELLIIRNWLQKTAPTPHAPENRRGYWLFTKLELVHQLRSKLPKTTSTTSNRRNFVNNLVEELDPDVVSRTLTQDPSHPRVLDPKDAEFEKALSQSLYSHIRSGDIARAMEICKSVDQPWHSAALRGAMTFSWNQIASDLDEEEEGAMDEDGARIVWNGNLRRKLWRKACQNGAMNSALPTSVCVLLASLAPSLTTLPTLAHGLTTWEDHMWARVSALFEERVDQLLERYGGFWSTQGISLDDQVSESNVLEESDEAVFEDEVRKVLDELKELKLFDRFDYSNRFHWAQLHVILGQTDSMFDAYAQLLRDGRWPAGDRNEHLQHVRFFAHMCLFLRHIGFSVPVHAADTILQAYISLLEEQERGDLVALYVGALGDNAIQRYAVFLSNLSLDLSKHDRLVAVNRAKEHGLDVEAVAFSTAGIVAREELKKLPSYTSSLPSPSDFDLQIRKEELVLCRSVEWLTFHESNHGHALRQANAILRYLLCIGSLSAARDLLLSLPPQVTSHAVSFGVEGPELVHFRHFFEVWDGFTGLGAVRTSEPIDPAQKMEALEWRKQYSITLDNVREACENLFTSGWLTAMEDEYGMYHSLRKGNNAKPKRDAHAVDERRSRETERIRQIYIPELVIRLHQELYVSRRLFPGNLRHIFRLTTIVADDRYTLYRDFVSGGKNRLDEYLGTVRSAALAVLDDGSKDPFSST